jgi:plasmid stabilization system protein ParE
MHLRYHPEAEAELVEATCFYEGKSPGLGARFRAEFDSATARILEAPERRRILEKDIRRFLMPRFPYSILYRVEGETVRILVVKHHSRHPDYWKGRIAG